MFKVISNWNGSRCPSTTGPPDGSIYFFTCPAHVQNASNGGMNTKEERIRQHGILLNFLDLLASTTSSGSSFLFARGGGWLRIKGTRIRESYAFRLANETVSPGCMINDVVGVQALATLVQSSETGDMVDDHSRLAPP
jgi:hypothetical protein